MPNTLKLIAASAYESSTAGQNILKIANDADVSTVAWQGVDCIELNFPKFTDGRAFSQAYLLRRRLGFTGELRATGDVLVDQVLQMQRSGFSSAVLRADQNLAAAQRQLARFDGFYQGDAEHPQPLFASTGASSNAPATSSTGVCA